VEIIDQYYERINRRIDHKRDFRFKYFGVSTLLRYLITAPNKAGGSILRERPQHMYMRVALSLLFDKEAPLESLDKAFALYDLLSTHKVSCASPILLNSGTTLSQHSSCFLLGIGDDLTSIFDTLKSTALISKRAGGIGFHLSSVRAENALIKSTGGKSCGIKNFIRLFHECQMTVNQGGLRPGAFAVYMEPWHADIYRFLVDLPRFRKERADTAPNLKYALWIPDAFMRALIDGTPWYLLSPDECPGLNAKWGAEFDALYESYVQKGLRGELRIFRIVSARDIALEAYRTIRETGTPYLGFKDNFNRLSNMQNVATIASSNLCIEIAIPSWSDHDAPLFGHEKGEVGVCNLGSIVVAEFVGDCADREGFCIDYAGISAAAGLLTEALDNVIDRNYYPVEAAERSNKRHRPIGIGMLGLADVFAMLKIVYGSRPAQQIDAAVMSAIYYGAVKKSAELAKLKGSYPSFDYNGGCPASRGQLQPDLWVANGFLETGWEDRLAEVTGITADDWDYLRAQVKCGLRNAYLTACMPTASTAIMVARNESFEPFTSNLYARNTLSGEFLMVNRYLLRELVSLGLWSHDLRMQLINDRGSVQGLPIPEDLKLRYRTAQEMDQRLSVQHSAARGPFVCQSQSLNFFYRKPQFRDVLTIMRDGWRAGLKTGAYYHHSDDGNTGFKSAVHQSSRTAKSVTNIEEAMEATAQELQRVAITTKEEDPAPMPTKLVKLESGVQKDAPPTQSMPALNVDAAIAFACPRGAGGPGCEACSG
jgi:ribonucleoside-diphosphate reductase alpha subunit